MINWFLIYFCICGFICYYAVSMLEKDNVPENYKEEIEEFRKEIFYKFGTFNIYPMLYCLSLILGWIIIPIGIIDMILEKFNISLK